MDGTLCNVWKGMDVSAKKRQNGKNGKSSMNSSRYPTEEIIEAAWLQSPASFGYNLTYDQLLELSFANGTGADDIVYVTPQTNIPLTRYSCRLIRDGWGPFRIGFIMGWESRGL